MYITMDALQIQSGDVIMPIGEEMFFGSYTKLYKHFANINTPRMFVRG